MTQEQEKRKLQDTILIIANEIHRICEDNNIKYFMDGGTQLGAVRHGGFIPWDDYFDIGMERKEYERFIEVCRKDLDKTKYYLETEEDEGYGFAFAKVHLNDTEIIENFSKKAKVHHGIFVDIFPYDNIPDSYISRRIFLVKNHMLKNLIWVKAGYGSEMQRKKMSYVFFDLIGKIFRLDNLKKIRKKLICKYDGKTTVSCFTSDYPRNFLKTSWLSKRIKYQFEQDFFWGLSDYDSFLNMLYGDYMKLPPKEKRVVHSTYKIDFGPY